MGFDFLIIPARVFNASLFPCHNVTKGLAGTGFVLHRLDLVRHDKLYPWKTSVEYETFWGEILLCLIFVLLFSWGCILCDTFTVPLLVICTSRLTHGAPVTHNNLVYYA